MQVILQEKEKENKVRQHEAILKALIAEQQKKDAERARLMLLGIRLQLGSGK
jgi:hypothetical protein